MADEPEKAIDEMAADTRTLGDDIRAEVKEDHDKAKGDGGPPKRPWWKAWRR